ncbi:MAG: hypothetical protein QNJ51_04785 [Calothrix sp. MO_167.B12]|nr:hypothetical protein [Calothrix sp. MO_167.B12]
MTHIYCRGAAACALVIGKIIFINYLSLLRLFENAIATYYGKTVLTT